MKRQKGFTVIELLAAVVILFVAGTLFLVQKRDIEMSHQDSARKTSINAIHHHLEEIYRPANGHYPQNIDQNTLKGLDPELLKDPAGQFISNGGDSTLRYEPSGCNEGKCRGYTLRANLEKEADYIKESR